MIGCPKQVCRELSRKPFGSWGGTAFAGETDRRSIGDDGIPCPGATSTGAGFAAILMLLLSIGCTPTAPDQGHDNQAFPELLSAEELRNQAKTEN